MWSNKILQQSNSHLRRSFYVFQSNIHEKTLIYSANPIAYKMVSRRFFSLPFNSYKKVWNTSYCKIINTKYLFKSLSSSCTQAASYQVPLSRNFSCLTKSQESDHRNLRNDSRISDDIRRDLRLNELHQRISNVSLVGNRFVHYYSAKEKKALRKGKTIYGGEDPFTLNENKLNQNENIDECITLQDTLTSNTIIGTPETYELSIKDHERITKLFPHPKVTLNNLSTMIGTDVMDVMHRQHLLKGKSKGKKVKTRFGEWTTTFKLTWPEPIVFTGTGLTKQLSSNKAATKALHWLHSQKKMTDDGYPIYDPEALAAYKKDLNKPIPVSIDNETEIMIQKIYKLYTKSIEPLLVEAHSKIVKQDFPLRQLPSDLTANEVEEEVEHGENVDINSIHGLQTAKQMEFHDLIFGVAPEEKDSEMMRLRNEYLFRRLNQIPPESQLPITDFREKIVDTVKNHRAVVIRGAPGCGKSTRVPRYLLDAAASEMQGASTNLLVSQPRRVAALALASRVADEYGEKIGNVCGHQVRLATVLPRPPGGAVLFCTAGALLRRLATSPALPGCTHLVLDEAHERSADSDAVMALARRAMDLNPRLKVIVMSATIDTHLFSRYYGDCPVLDIPGFTYPVQSHYLSDLLKQSGMRLFKTRESSKPDSKAMVDAEEVSGVIRWVNSNRPEGAILCFLPGWQEIKKVHYLLESDLENSKNYIILPVHSRLSNEDQKKIFSTPPPGVRKIILATNIAETSITINDVSYVIDTGVHKEHKLSDQKGISSLNNEWVSKASVHQRKGRAGRVKPGECFHLYTKEKMETFVEDPIPEILRVPLEKTVLDCKTYSEKDKALDFLRQFPEPPSPEAIQIAVNDLIRLGAIDEDEKLTPLGRRIVSFTTHPKISKALVYSSIFKVASPIIDLSAMLSNNIDFFSVVMERRKEVRDLKAQYHPTSDHLALYWLSQHYQEIRAKEGPHNAKQFCRRINLRMEKVISLYELRKICFEHLQQCKMLPQNIRDKNSRLRMEDELSGVDELVKGVLLSGLGTLLCSKTSVKTKGKLSKVKDIVADRGQRAFVSTSSLNCGIEKQDEPVMLLYCGAVHSRERGGLLVRDTSLIQPVTAFLFSQNVEEVYRDTKRTLYKTDNQRIKFEVTPEQSESLDNLREMIWSVANYYVENQGFNGVNNYSYNSLRDTNDETFSSGGSHNASQTINQFRDALLKIVADLLNKAEGLFDSINDSGIDSDDSEKDF